MTDQCPTCGSNRRHVAYTPCDDTELDPWHVEIDPLASLSYPTPTTEICVLCGAPIDGYGNNPEPLASYDDGRACDDCNTDRVIPARLMALASHVDRPTWVLVATERARDGDKALEGQYLQSYDPDAYDGHGWATWTDDPERALRFMKAGDALTFWRQQSVVKPIRADGHPNRPLTTYTVEVRNLR